MTLYNFWKISASESEDSEDGDEGEMGEARGAKRIWRALAFVHLVFIIDHFIVSLSNTKSDRNGSSNHQGKKQTAAAKAFPLVRKFFTPGLATKCKIATCMALGA
jgi:hypothetical protein